MTEKKEISRAVTRDDEYARRKAFTPVGKAVWLSPVGVHDGRPQCYAPPCQCCRSCQGHGPPGSWVPLAMPLIAVVRLSSRAVWRCKPEEQRKHICPSASTASPTPSSRELLSAWRWRRLPFPLGMRESSTPGRQADREVWLCGSRERRRPEGRTGRWEGQVVSRLFGRLTRDVRFDLMHRQQSND
jgi:hypothetical protein